MSYNNNKYQVLSCFIQFLPSLPSLLSFYTVCGLKIYLLPKHKYRWAYPNGILTNIALHCIGIGIGMKLSLKNLGGSQVDIYPCKIGLYFSISLPY